MIAMDDAGQDASPVNDGDGLPPELQGCVDPIRMVRSMSLVRTATMIHVAVPMHARTDVVPGLVDLGTNMGLGICPVAACGQRLLSEYAEKAWRADYGDAANITCARCRRIVEANRPALMPRFGGE